MSASVGVYVATALFLAIGGETEEAMREEPEFDDGTPQCQALIARNQSCRPLRGGRHVILWQMRNSQDPTNQERSWDEIWGSKPICPPDHQAQGYRVTCVARGLLEEIILSPRWVPSAEPTGIGQPGYWLKLQL